MKTFKNLSIIIVLLCCINQIFGEFYLPGFRYYNSNECYDASQLSKFDKHEDPSKNKDKFIQMKAHVRSAGTTMNMGAFFSSDNKSQLIDSHQFFLYINQLDSHEKKYFPSHVYCYKQVNFFLYGFGAWDSYGIVYVLNPSIDEYATNSVVSSSKWSFLDLFEIFLDYSRALEVIIKNNYYVANMSSDDLGIYLKRENDGEVKVQGRLRLLHKMRKGDDDSNCEYKKMDQFINYLNYYKVNSGSSDVPLKGVSTCQMLNINSMYDIFEEKARQVMRDDFRDADLNFSHCFEDNTKFRSKCPEPLKPIWDSKNMRYLYRSIRKLGMKWTADSIIERTIEIFEKLRDGEINRLAVIEKKKLIKMKLQQKFKEIQQKNAQKRIIKLMKENIQSQMSHVPDSIITEDDPEIRVENSIDPNFVEKINKESERDIASTEDKIINKIEIDHMPVNYSESLKPLSKELIHERSHASVSLINSSEESHKLNEISIKKSEVEELESELSTEIKNKQKILQENNALKNEIMASFVTKLKEKIKKDKDEDEQIISEKAKKSDVPILESEERIISQEFKKEELLKSVEQNILKRIENIKTEESIEQEINKDEDITSIMDLKIVIDNMKRDDNINVRTSELNSKIKLIGEKIDLAIKKYGSSTEVVDSNQVIFSLKTLKREMDPYYLKREFKNKGKLKVKVQNDQFVFL